jgi:cytochrome c oxidase subunit II
MHPSRRSWLRACWTGVLTLLVGARRSAAQEPDGVRTVALSARRYVFDPEVIDVRRNDIVRLTLTSEDIAHSFTIEAYRIQKRIPPGGTIRFEFRADEVGRFPFYCSMRAEAGCSEMRGELIVR